MQACEPEAAQPQRAARPQSCTLDGLEGLSGSFQAQEVPGLWTALDEHERACLWLEAQSAALDSLRGDDRRWGVQRQEVFRLGRVLKARGAELEALRQENQRLQAEAQEMRRLQGAPHALREESRKLELHKQQRVAELHEEIARLREALFRQSAELEVLRLEGQALQAKEKELLELREALKLERLSASAQQSELTVLRACLADPGSLASPEAPSGDEPLRSAAPRQEQRPTHDHKIFLDSCMHGQELSGVSQIQDEETISLGSMMVERQQPHFRESELTELRTALEAQTVAASAPCRQSMQRKVQDAEGAKLDRALEVQTPRLGLLPRERQHSQASEGELLDLHVAASERRQTSPQSGSVVTDGAWSLTSTNTTSLVCGPGFESMVASPRLSAVQPACAEREAAGPPPASGGTEDCHRWPGQRCSGLEVPSGSGIEETWRLVRAILSTLDATQQKLDADKGTSALQKNEAWRSVSSVDIRILVGAGEEAREGLGLGQTFMYVLI